MSTNIVSQVLSEFEASTGLPYRSVHDLRLVVFNELLRKRPAQFHSSDYGEDDDLGLFEDDQQLVDAGLVKVGPWERNPHPMSLSHTGGRAATLTEKGRVLGQQLIDREVELRRAGHPQDFEQWWRDVHAPI